MTTIIEECSMESLHLKAEQRKALLRAFTAKRAMGCQGSAPQGFYSGGPWTGKGSAALPTGGGRTVLWLQCAHFLCPWKDVWFYTMRAARNAATLTAGRLASDQISVECYQVSNQMRQHCKLIADFVRKPTRSAHTAIGNI